MEQKQILNKEQKIIYSKRVCEQLMLLGFRPIETIPNPLKPEFICWVFEWTKEFDAALSAILSTCGQKGGAGNGCT